MDPNSIGNNASNFIFFPLAIMHKKLIILISGIVMPKRVISLFLKIHLKKVILELLQSPRNNVAMDVATSSLSPAFAMLSPPKVLADFGGKSIRLPARFSGGALRGLLKRKVGSRVFASSAVERSIEDQKVLNPRV